MSNKNLSAQEQISQGNFKHLYNRKYGDFAQVSNQSRFTPEQIFDIAVAYFGWAESNAIKAAETASFQGEVEESLVHKVRVFTLNGLCLYGGFSQTAWAHWRKMEGYKDVAEWVDSVIYEQKFQLAANGIVNAGFLGKEMGIDKPANITVETSSNSQAVAAASTEEMMLNAVNSVLDEL